MTNIIVRPIITEKLSKNTAKSAEKQYGFVVAKDANKLQIRTAIEEMYEVQVSSIRTAITSPRSRRRYTKSGVISGKSSSYKKAYVTLLNAKTLDFYKTS